MQSDQKSADAPPDHRALARAFDAWVDSHPAITPITDQNRGLLRDLLANEHDPDSFALSPVYYLATGREGLWIYSKDDSLIPFCRHPADPQQILIFPPRGARNFAAISDFLNEAVAPAGGFCLARFRPEDLNRLQISYAFLQRASFAPVVEKLMDWRFGTRHYVTSAIAAIPDGQIWQGVELSRSLLPAAAAMIDETSSLAGKYRAALKLVGEGVAQGYALLRDGQPAAIAVWDVVHSNGAQVAAVHAVLGEQNILPIALRAAAAFLSARGIGIMAFGGETAALIERGGLLPPAMAKLDLCSVKAQLHDECAWSGYNDSTRHMRLG